MNDQLQMMSQSQILQSQQNYVVWPPYLPENSVVFACLPVFHAPPPLPPPLPLANPLGRVKWKGNKKEFRRNDRIRSSPSHLFINDSQPSMANHSSSKGRRCHHPRRKFSGGSCVRFVAPFAPHNTTSFIIRAKKSGGIASLISPCPDMSTILPTPMLSSSREVVVEMAKEKLVIDGYGSMKGLIHLRSEKEKFDENEENSDEDGADGSGCVKVEKRLDHNLSRFKMIHPNSHDYRTLESRVDEQDTQIAHLEEENATLREREFSSWKEN